MLKSKLVSNMEEFAKIGLWLSLYKFTLLKAYKPIMSQGALTSV